MILDGGVPLPGATVLFTASNWDSTLSQLSNDSGKASIFCVPAGGGYEVTVLKSGYETSHISTEARRDRPVVAIELHRVVGRYVLVMHRGVAIPGVTVTVTDSDGTVQTVTTDESGAAPFWQLKISGDAIIEISLPGFTQQRARIGSDFKNGPVVFDMPIETSCTR